MNKREAGSNNWFSTVVSTVESVGETGSNCNTSDYKKIFSAKVNKGKKTKKKHDMRLFFVLKHGYGYITLI